MTSSIAKATQEHVNHAIDSQRSHCYGNRAEPSEVELESWQSDLRPDSSAAFKPSDSQGESGLEYATELSPWELLTRLGLSCFSSSKWTGALLPSSKTDERAGRAVSAACRQDAKYTEYSVHNMLIIDSFWLYFSYFDMFYASRSSFSTASRYSFLYAVRGLLYREVYKSEGSQQISTLLDVLSVQKESHVRETELSKLFRMSHPPRWEYVWWSAVVAVFRCFVRIAHRDIYASTVSYTSIGGHVQTRLRSPYTLSILPTVGQNLAAELTQGAGNAAVVRE
jgi:hypothetical protein